MALAPTTSGGGSSTSITISKPAGNITRNAATIASFSTPWTVVGNPGTGQNVIIDIMAYCGFSTGNADYLLALFRGGSQIAGWCKTNNTTAVNGLPILCRWVDENPGAGPFTYEVQAAMYTGGTLTVYQANQATDAVGGVSMLTATVYSP